LAEEIWEVWRDQRYAWVKANITFLPTSAGGRSTSVDLSGAAFYRPHIVIGNSEQRDPIVREQNIIDEEYLAVQFRPGNKIIAPGQSTIVKLELIYYPANEYHKITRNTEFTIREGPRIIGYGKVLRTSYESTSRAKG
jgi:translation elongation factor EF-1alpha